MSCIGFAIVFACPCLLFYCAIPYAFCSFHIANHGHPLLLYFFDLFLDTFTACHYSLLLQAFILFSRDLIAVSFIAHVFAKHFQAHIYPHCPDLQTESFLKNTI